MLVREIKEVADFLEVLSKDDDGAATWFRGHGKSTWPLLPGFMREKSNLSEASTLARFKQSAAMLTDRLPTSSFEWTFLMQHYGVPTRLLDWSESPLVALYFAVEKFEKYKRSNAALWCLKPVALNKNANLIDPDEPQYIPSFEDKELNPYMTEEIKSARVPLFPVATIATRNNVRIQAQSGTFTIHHSNKTPLEKIGNGSHVIKYVIPATARSVFKKELKLLGITQFSLFPELTSVGAMLKEMMR